MPDFHRIVVLSDGCSHLQLVVDREHVPDKRVFIEIEGPRLYEEAVFDLDEDTARHLADALCSAFSTDDPKE